MIVQFFEVGPRLLDYLDSALNLHGFVAMPCDNRLV